MKNAQNLCNPGWGPGGRGQEGLCGSRWVGSADQGEPREAQVGRFQQSPPLRLPRERRQAQQPHVGAGRPGKRGPQRKAPPAGFGSSSSSAAARWRHPGIAPAD